MTELSDDQIEIINDFVQESRDSLEQLELKILDLESSDNADQDINFVFRLFHSMKGTASFLGMAHIASVTHAAENLLDQIRSGAVKMKTPEHINLFIAAADFAKEGLDYVEENLHDEGLADNAEKLSAILHRALDLGADEGMGHLPPALTSTPAPSPTEPEAFSIEEAFAIVASEKAEAAIDTAQSDPPPKTPAHSPAQSVVGFGSGFDLTPEIAGKFVTESDELLANIEEGLLEWISMKEDPAELIACIYRDMHSFKGNCGFFGYSDLEKLGHHMENVLDRLKEGGVIDRKSAGDLLLQLVDALQEGLAAISNGEPPTIQLLTTYVALLDNLMESVTMPPDAPPPRIPPPPKKEEEPSPEDSGQPDTIRPPQPIGEILVEKGDVAAADLDQALELQKQPIGKLLVEMGAATPKAVETALASQKAKEPGAPLPKGGVKRTVKRQDIRVDLQKLDNLINLIGELVIAENMVVNNPDLEGLELENFHKAAQQTGKIVRDLQEMAMIIRLVPISGLFRRMTRLVHDVSAKVGKKVELKLSGEETEVDKTIIESLTDPLVHMIRNSVDHGIGTAEERIAVGKAEVGVVNLTASHEEGEVWIVIEDDGKGLNRDKILEKAVAKGLVQGDPAALKDRDIYGFIFQPGFSTADVVTAVSGRGVGMDVVRQNLDKIGCKIDVESFPGKGSRFTLRIPLTLAIIDGMLIRVGRSRYIVPILHIRETFCPTLSAITTTTDGQELVRVRDDFYPVLRIHELHDVEPDSRALNEGILIIVETSDGNMALFIDEILGQQQAVIKGISKYLADVGSVRGVSGCTILGNGEVCLILDVGALMNAEVATVS